MNKKRALQAATDLMNHTPKKRSLTMKQKLITAVIFLGPTAMFAADRIAHAFGFCLGF